MSLDPITDVLNTAWLEQPIVGKIRIWHLIFICIAGVTTLALPFCASCSGDLGQLDAKCIVGEVSRKLNEVTGDSRSGSFLVQMQRIAIATQRVVMVCCCFRFRIPRTKQQIEADYQRRKITCKFRQRLETIQDAKMDAMSLKDALDLLHEISSPQMESTANQPESQPSSIVSPQQSSLDASFQPEGGQKPEPQVSNPSFVKFASKVATLTKLGAPKSPTTTSSPTASGNKMDF